MSTQASVRSELEATPDAGRDACPETGNLFRYSGELGPPSSASQALDSIRHRIEARSDV